MQKKSIHSSPSLVLVRKGNLELPAVIHKCLKLTVQLHEHSTEEYIVQVHWIEDHPNKDWFGTEIQVWQLVQDAVASDYIFTDNIVCRCAQVTTKIMFQTNESRTTGTCV